MLEAKPCPACGPCPKTNEKQHVVPAFLACLAWLTLVRRTATTAAMRFASPRARASRRATPRACPASLPRQRTPGFQSGCSARPDPVLAPAGSSFPSSAEARRRRRQRCQKPCSLRLRSRREFSEGVPGRWRDDNDVCAARKAGSARSGTDSDNNPTHVACRCW